MPDFDINWESLGKDLLENCEKYHGFFYKKFPFGGPSLHFHERALSAKGEDRIEMIYAMLASWGMHRMGGGAKMNDYPDFKDSVLQLEGLIAEIVKKIAARSFSYEDMKCVFNCIAPMKTKKKLVGHSKVLAHLFPDAVSPIDGEYTMQFVFGKGKKNLPNGFDEFEFFKQFHQNLIKPLMENDEFKKKCGTWVGMRAAGNSPWDTSLPKVIDNLIVGKISEEKI